MNEITINKISEVVKWHYSIYYQTFPNYLYRQIKHWLIINKVKITWQEFFV